ncbi:MAG: hypothetical protein NT118_08840 [Lentisphaerae bacterium]|nr:hypothetical protein [Lentisphaerota bacterium]
MKFSVKSAFLSAAILTLAYSQGCASVSYNGKSYAPTESVEIVKKQKEIPNGYELMGKAVGTAPAEEGSRQEMEKKIIQKAKSEGADAVMIILFEEVKIGEERDDQFMNTSHDDAGWGLNVDTEGDTNQIDSSNTRIDKGDRLETPVYKSVIKALFLKKIN